MKKLISTLLVLIFVFAATGFVSSATSKTNNKGITKTGIIIIKNNILSLKTAEGTFVLTGQVKELKKMNNIEVKVNGYLNNKKFVVKNYTVIKKTTPVGIKPTTPAAVTVKTTIIVGLVTENDLEGKHYELVTKIGTFTMIGMNNDEFAKYAGKNVKVTGKILEKQLSIYQRGTILNVTTIEPVGEISTLPSDDSDKSKVKIVERTGTISINQVKGAPIALLVDDLVYGLSGNVSGLDKMNGKKVKISGYIPDIKYIRAPDFIMFEVVNFTEVK